MDGIRSFREMAWMSFLFIVFAMVSVFGESRSVSDDRSFLISKTEAGLSSINIQNPEAELNVGKQSGIDFNSMVNESLASQAELNQEILKQTQAVKEAFEFERKYRHPTQSDRIRRTAQYQVESNKSQAGEVSIVLLKVKSN